MGDTACVMHGFSHASAIPNESIQGNSKHALCESISFGRFMTDQSLSWEKWSAFSNKKYVEEAERYAQPGSVAQKKAFFEAQYKKIAAQKAADLLEQQNATKTVSGGVGDNNASVDVKMEEVKIRDLKQNDVTNINEHSSIAVTENGKDGENVASSENNVTLSTKKSCLDSTDKKRSSSKSLLSLMNLVPIKELDRDPISATKKTESSPKDCSTSLRNPVVASTKGASSFTEPSPQSENRSCSKSLRTEERTAKRKQKHEEKLNANEAHKVEQQKTLKVKAGNRFRKLSCSFCFKAQPPLDSYSDGETPGDQIEKTPRIQPRTAELARSNSNKMHGSISVPPPTCSVKNSPSENLSKK